MVYLRQLLPTDAAAFKALRIFSMQESPKSFGSSVTEEEQRSLESIEAMFSSPLHYRVGVFDADKLVASAGSVRLSREKTKHKADIFGVYVLPEYRGKGLSRQMMQSIIERAKQTDGLETLLLAVTEGNNAAHWLYSSLGFLEYGREPDALRVNGEPVAEIFMRLELHTANSA
jgi:RimJ/RimL family protein N-acetyltransferase